MILEGNEIFKKAKRLYKYMFVSEDFLKHWYIAHVKFTLTLLPSIIQTRLLRIWLICVKFSLLYKSERI